MTQSNINFKKIEGKIKEFWEKNKIYEFDPKKKE